MSLQKVNTDETKIEANASSYTFVWGNAIKTNNQHMEKPLEKLWGSAITLKPPYYNIIG